MISNNDIIRRLRYTFKLSDAEMHKVFAEAKKEIKITDVKDWLQKEDHPDFQKMKDEDLAAFLNGLIIKYRGRKDGAPMPNEKQLNNNLILRKLKIALSLKDHDLQSIFKRAGADVSKHEINAFFRHPDQKQFRECLDQYLRNFLTGLQIKMKEERQKA